MRPNKIKRVQNHLFAYCMAAAIAGLSAKANLALDQKSGRFIDLGYFINHFNEADLWATAYWASIGIVTLLLPALMILQTIRQRS